MNASSSHSSVVTDQTPSGACYKAPPGWSCEVIPGGVLYVAPENDLYLLVADAANAVSAGDAADIVRLAGGLARQDADPDETFEARRGGWDEIVSLRYPMPPHARSLFQAMAFRGAAGWTAVIISGAVPTFEKRAPDAMLLLQSLAAPGFREENVAGVSAKLLDADRLELLRQFVSDAMQRLKVPGVAYAVLQGDRVLVGEGLGVRNVHHGGTVDAHTLFPIASNTKSLTTLLLARLIDEDRIGWNDRASDVYPAFRLGTREITDQVCIRHLVSASTGLPRRDLVWSFTNRADTPAGRIFDMLADEVPTSHFGEVFQYNNLMAAAAGFIAGHVAYPETDPAIGYDLALRTKLLEPMGMLSTSFDLDRICSGGNYTMLHGLDDEGVPVAIDPSITAVNYASRPSGGAWSSVHDMIRYVRLELSEGVLPDGSTLVSRANLLARRLPGVRIGAETFYGMGLIIDNEAGVTVIRHGGSTPGAMSDIFILPGADVGAVLLTNADAGMFLLNPFKRRLIELLYDLEEKAELEIAAAETRILEDLARSLAQTHAPDFPNGLVSLYRSDVLGELKVDREGDVLIFAFSSIRCPMRVRIESDGTRSFITAHPVLRGFIFAEERQTRCLILCEGQHEYRFAACDETA